MSSPRVTIKDVARASGVSPATVSFVLNETRGQTIPAPTRERVRDAARSLGYVADGIGRALREGTSRVVLLDVGSLRGGTMLEEFILGMSDELAVHGHSLLVQHGTHDKALQTAIAAISPRAVVNIDGPFAAVDPSNPEGGWVYGLASHTVTQLRYLAEKGHRQVAFVVPEGRQSRFTSERWRHATQAAAELGIESIVPLIAGRDRATTASALAALRREHPRVTALAAADDEAAVASLSAMTELALRAPDDLAVIGFGDSEFGAQWVPTLTTVHVDATGLGQHAARVALSVDDLPELVSRSHVVARESA